MVHARKHRTMFILVHELNEQDSIFMLRSVLPLQLYIRISLGLRVSVCHSIRKFGLTADRDKISSLFFQNIDRAIMSVEHALELCGSARFSVQQNKQRSVTQNICIFFDLVGLTSNRAIVAVYGEYFMFGAWALRAARIPTTSSIMLAIRLISIRSTTFKIRDQIMFHLIKFISADIWCEQIGKFQWIVFANSFKEDFVIKRKCNEILDINATWCWMDVFRSATVSVGST